MEKPFTLYWKSIANDIQKKAKGEHPENWEETKIKNFLEGLDETVVEHCMKDRKKASLFKLPLRNGNYIYDHFFSISPVTFRRLFKYKNSSGKRTTRDIFAIYLGYDSYVQYIEKNIDLKQAMPRTRLGINSYNFSPFWDQIARDVEKVMHIGDLTYWKPMDIRVFLKKMKAGIFFLCKNDRKKEILCGQPIIIPTLLEFQYIFQEKSSSGTEKHKHQFAIYLGYDSYHHYLTENDIMLQKNFDLSQIGY